MWLDKRWLFLLFSSLTFFSAEIVEDQLSLLNARLQGTAEACYNGEDTSCLHFTSAQFNSLFVTGFWAGGVASVFAGFFICKYGIWIASWVTAILLACGTLLSTCGPYSPTSNVGYCVMLFGRLLFASGYFGNQVLSLEVQSHWFRGKELAFAFTIYLSCSRLATVLSFAFIGALVEQLGLQTTFWCTFGIGMVAPISAVSAGFLYRRSSISSLVDSLRDDRTITGTIRLSNIKGLGRMFWLLCGIIFFYYAVLFTFIVDGPKFIIDVHNSTEAVAGPIIGITSDISMFAPIFGLLIDRIGCRDLITFGSTGVFFLAALLPLIKDRVSPIAVCVLVAISYSMMTASLWSSIPVITKPSLVGVAMGIGTGTQAFASGLMLLVMGFLLDVSTISVSTRWHNFFIIMTAFAAIACVLSVVSIHYDRKDGGRKLRMRHTSVLPNKAQAIGEHTPLLNSEDKKIMDHSANFS